MSDVATQCSGQIGEVCHDSSSGGRGRFGMLFEKSLTATKNKPIGSPDFGDVEVKTSINGGRITLFELSDVSLLQWIVDPKDFVSKHGVQEDDGWKRLDRTIHAAVVGDYVQFSYDSEAFVKIPIGFFISKFNFKLKTIILQEGYKIDKDNVRWTGTTLIKHPEMTAAIARDTLPKWKIESRMKYELNTEKSLYRLIFRITPSYLKTMSTQTIATPVSSVPITTTSTPRSILTIHGNSEIKATLNMQDGKTYRVALKLMMLTPKVAKDFLDNIHPRQRKLRPSRTRMWTDEFARHHIHLTGDAIIIENGKMINGQHRCHSSINSNEDIPVMVLETDDVELYGVIDKGLGRTFADEIGKETKYPRETGSTISYVMRYDQGIHGKRGTTLWGGDVLHNPARRKDYFLEHRTTLEEAIILAQEDDNKHFAPAIGAAFLELAWRKKTDKRKAARFIHQIIDGVGLKRGYAVYLLRTWLEDVKLGKIGKRDSRPEMIFGQLVEAYNCFCTNKNYKLPRPTRKGTKVTKEVRKFPRIYWEKPPVAVDPKATNYFPAVTCTSNE